MDDPVAVEFNILSGIGSQEDVQQISQHDGKKIKQTPEFHPTFASQPASKFESDPAPMTVQQAVAGEALDQIWTGFSGGQRNRGADLQRHQEVSRTPKQMYIPKSFPFTHTSIEMLGTWPQRLLHVPTMTSYSWEPGNVYGGQREPQYRAVSYTWGRWRLRSKQAPRVKGLNIKVTGLDPWEIPSIDSKHFDVKVFRQLLDTVRAPVRVVTHQPEEDSMLKNFPATEFVWLDVACIDQRWGPVAAMEVGRQADIFRRASGVSIWLSRSGTNTASLARLRDFVSSLIYGNYLCPPWDITDEQWQADMLCGIRELLCDPWFTSLWTLQEAFLAQDAYFITASGAPLTLLSDKLFNSSTFTLSMFTDACRCLSKQCRKLPDVHLKFATEFEGWMQKSNLNNLVRNANPLALLSAAKYRFASEDQDHIYGIMQVFRYRLGTSAPDARPDRSYTRSELTAQLGEAMFHDRLVQSQLHAFTEPVERGKGWHLSPSSAIPSCYIEPLLPLQENREPIEGSTPRCRLSTKKVGSTLLGFFEGLACPFAKLQVPWRQQDDRMVRIHKNMTGIDDGHGCPLSFRMAPDVNELIYDSPEYKTWELIDIPEDIPRQNAFACWLNTNFEQNRLIVLLLGQTYSNYYGIILLHVEVESTLYWHRLGTCSWAHVWKFYPEAEPYADVMHARGRDWVPMSGIWG